jgi:acyl transferase domain-containing protein
MLAVLAPIGVVEEVLHEGRLDLIVANRNAPRQFVLSGDAEAIARAAEVFARRKVVTRELPVAAAFHSPAVAGACGPFLDALRACSLTPTATPVYSNTTAAPFPQDPDEARALLAAQIASPVEFLAEVEAMAADGVGVFLEVGPGAVLSGLVRATLDAARRPGVAVAVDATRGERGDVVDLAAALAELASLGYPVRARPMGRRGWSDRDHVRRPQAGPDGQGLRRQRDPAASGHDIPASPPAFDPVGRDTPPGTDCRTAHEPDHAPADT